MKKRIVLSVFFLVCMFCLSACSNTLDDQRTSDPMDQEEQNASEEKEQDEKEPITEQEESDGRIEQIPLEKSVNIVIYYSNDDATAFVTEKVQINSLSPEEVLNALIEKGVIAADVQVRSFETTTVDGKSTILLDFNSIFSSYISSRGSTGEYYVIGSVCNTFLDAYDCEQIQITAEGNTLSTGHAEYSGYMTKFS